MYIFPFDVHGIRGVFRTKDLALHKFVQRNYLYFSTIPQQYPGLRPVPQAETSLDVCFNGYYSGFAHRRQLVDLSRFCRLGSGMYSLPTELFWESNLFQIYVKNEQDRLTVNAAFYERKDQTIRRVILRGGEFLYQHYQLITRYIMHFPVLWLLAHRRGIYPIHAAAVEKEGKAYIFAGLNGSGKSTLAAFMVFNHGYRILADNFTLIDSHQVYGFHECLRLSPSSTSFLNLSEDISRHRIYGKVHIKIDPDRVSLIAKPEAVFLTSLGDRLEIKPINCTSSLEMMKRAQDFLGEDYRYAYINFLHPFIKTQSTNLGSPSARKTDTEVLMKFLQSTPTFMLKLPREMHLAEVAEAIANVYVHP